MNIKLEPGTYVVAVSGGVDSMVLLDVLRRLPNLKLIVAHFDHGIRPDSSEDRRLVQATAMKYGLDFEYATGNLGSQASEAAARQARYNFLFRVKEAYVAKGIITAHHLDDVLETTIHNLLRGSGRLGLASLRSRGEIIRPLLHVSKSEILAYANRHDILWREDSTNTDMRYRRNYIRHNITANLSEKQKMELLQHIRKVESLNDEIDGQISQLLHKRYGKQGLNRHWFIMLPHNVSRETMAVWLRLSGVTEISSNMLERLVMAAKTYQSGKQTDIDKHYVLTIDKETLAIRPRER